MYALPGFPVPPSPAPAKNLQLEGTAVSPLSDATRHNGRHTDGPSPHAPPDRAASYHPPTHGPCPNIQAPRHNPPSGMAELFL